jgi:hypothetical protein
MDCTGGPHGVDRGRAHEASKDTSHRGGGVRRHAHRLRRPDLADLRGCACRPLRGADHSRQGRVYGGPSGGKLSNFKNELTGCGPFLHDDPRDRPMDVFGGVTRLHFGTGRQPYLLLPIVPPNKGRFVEAWAARVRERALPIF